MKGEQHLPVSLYKNQEVLSEKENERSIFKIE